jgi:hypothetical protein
MLIFCRCNLGIRPIEYFRLIKKLDFTLAGDRISPDAHAYRRYWPQNTLTRMMAEAWIVNIRVAKVNHTS